MYKYKAEHCESIVWYMKHVCTIFIQHGLLFTEMVSKQYYPVCTVQQLVLFVCMSMRDQKKH